MGNVRFIGCLHFGHEWMAKYRGFKDSATHDNHLIEQWNKTVCKKDIIYILGDITMENAEYYHNLEKLKGIKRVVLGNHDRYQDTHKLLKYVETVAGMVDYKGYILTHAPIHPSEISFYSGNIHAHIHHVNELYELYVPERYGDKSKVEYPTLHKYYNVDAHNINYKPVTLQELCEIKKE